MKTFIGNMKEGVSYYQRLFENASNSFDDIKHQIQKELEKTEDHLSQIQLSIQNLSLKLSN